MSLLRPVEKLRYCPFLDCYGRITMKGLAKALAVSMLMTGVVAPAFADISFSGSWPPLTGTIAPGEGWAANAPGGTTNSWGSPGAGLGTLTWPTADHVTDFHVLFVLPAGVDVVFQQAANCGGGPFGGTTFCSSPFSTPWTAVSDQGSPDGISFYAPAGTFLTAGGSYFVNIFFTGPVPQASFTGSWSVPEPASVALFGL